jgi:flagellar biogenesis protein FliO
MLSFDTPYNGKVFLKKDGHDFIITLNNIHFNKKITKNINSPIISGIEIIPKKTDINIILKSKKEINIIASKTTDGFGLRLRAMISNRIPQKTSFQKNTLKNSDIKAFDSLPLDKKGYTDSRYYMVILVLFLLLIVLWIVKKRLFKPAAEKNWLFKNSVNENEVKILYRKAIDAKNSVLVLSYMDKRYLVLTGSSNQLLDKFSSDNESIDDDKEFEEMFAKNRKKLDEFLKVGNDKLSSYADKASLDLTTADDLKLR